MTKINLTAAEDVDCTTEVWTISDLSTEGVGGVLPNTAGTWVKIGDLCGIKATNNPVWWIGLIRRLRTEHKGAVHVGIEILAKKPLSVWLRILGKGAEMVSNWESSSGSFEYDYLPVILLPDVNDSYENATMLMESGKYVLDTIYQAMMGEKSRDIKLTGLLEEGEDFEQVSFQWLNPAHVAKARLLAKFPETAPHPDSPSRGNLPVLCPVHRRIKYRAGQTGRIV